MIDLKENKIEIMIFPANESKIGSAEVGLKIKHITTNITVESWTEKIQHRNKIIAIDKLERELCKQVNNTLKKIKICMVIFLMYLKKRYRLSISWLINPKTPLESSTPLSLIATVYGKKKVLDILYRFKTGDFS